MRVARLHGPGDIRVADEPEPSPGPGEVLVQVTSVGICGSDLHWYDESGVGEARLDRPLVLGHEAAGVIASGPRAGERVAIDPSLACERCSVCARGLGHLCPGVRFLGHSSTDGALREVIAWPADHLVPVPGSLDDDATAMLEPLGVAIHAFRLARFAPGGTVAVLGAGPIGRMLIRLALASGATAVVATDVLPHRVAAARDDGAIAELVDGGGERARLLEALGGRPVDVAIEIAGEADAVATGVDLVKPGGVVVVAGIPTGNEIPVPVSAARRKGLDLRFSRRMNRVHREAIALTASGRVDPAVVVSHRFGLGEAGVAFATAVRREGHKVIIRCDR
jgi:L-iditol 2-dehydrogenase